MGRKTEKKTTETTCPVCGATLALTAEVEVKRRGFWDWLTGGGSSTRYESSVPQFAHTATAALPQVRHEPRQEAGPLAPGEAVWRKMDMDDIRLPAALGVVGVAFPVVAVTLGIGSALIWKPLLWVTLPIGIILVGADVVFWAMVWPLVRHDDTPLVMRKRDADTPPPPAPEPRPYRVRGEMVSGATTLYVDFDVDNPWKWHAFCQEVDGGRCAFSAAAAKDHSVDLGPILDVWTRRDLVDKRSLGKGKTPQLTRAGRAMVRKFAITPPPELEVA